MSLSVYIQNAESLSTAGDEFQESVVAALREIERQLGERQKPPLDLRFNNEPAGGFARASSQDLIEELRGQVAAAMRRAEFAEIEKQDSLRRLRSLQDHYADLASAVLGDNSPLESSEAVKAAREHRSIYNKLTHELFTTTTGTVGKVLAKVREAAK